MNTNIPPKDVAITPFNKPFFTELHALFALHLPHHDLKSYSLVSRAFNREANRVLWRSVRVLAHYWRRRGVIEGFVQALVRDSVRAACVLRVNFINDVRDYDSMFPANPTERHWNSLEETFRLLIRLKSIGLTIHNGYCSSAPYDPTYPEQFLNIIASVFAASPLVAFDACLPLYRFLQFCQLWPTVVTLRFGNISRADLVGLPPEALPQLRHAELDLGSMRHIIRGRPIETLYQFLPHSEFFEYGSNDFEWVAESIRCCKTLLRARAYGVSKNVEHSPTLLPLLVHDNLRELEFRVILLKPPWLGTDDDRLGWLLTREAIQTLPPGVLARFPKLETLRIILYGRTFGSATESVDDECMGRVANWLARRLTSETSTALNCVEIHYCECSHFIRDYASLSFLATCRESHWDVKFSRNKALICTRIDDVC